jgi:hypothetical protein
VLYEGRQFFFGHVDVAEDYFVSLCFVKSSRVTTADFLTSINNPSERVIRRGHEGEVLRLLTGFANVWRHSELAKSPRVEVEEFDSKCVRYTGGHEKHR